MKSFREYIEEEEYRGSHKAPTKDDDVGAPMHNLKGVYPDDFYGPKGFHIYSDYGSSHDRVAHNIAVSAKGRPDKQLRIYRSVPKNIEKAKISKGDWVATTRQYAKEHGDSVHGKGNHRILSKAVHARDLFTTGDSVHEWGYDPQPYTPKAERT